MKPIRHPIRAINFDAVGTVIHSVRPVAEVYAQIGGRFGSRRSIAVITQRIRTALAREDLIDRQREWRTSEDRERQRWQSIVSEVLDDVSDPSACFQELFEHFGRTDAWRCDPGFGALLRQLADQGFFLGMASNFDGRLRQVMQGLPGMQAIQSLVISSEVGCRKPSAAFFQAVCQSANLAPRQVLHVGDDIENDFKGAADAGLQALLFDPANRFDGRLSQRIASLDELVDLAIIH